MSELKKVNEVSSPDTTKTFLDHSWVAVRFGTLSIRPFSSGIVRYIECVPLICLKTTHDELQALQLAYTQLEKRYQELDATNAFLRREITEKMEPKCSALNQEVEDHQKWVFRWRWRPSLSCDVTFVDGWKRTWSDDWTKRKMISPIQLRKKRLFHSVFSTWMYS